MTSKWCVILSLTFLLKCLKRSLSINSVTVVVFTNNIAQDRLTPPPPPPIRDEVNKEKRSNGMAISMYVINCIYY